MRSALARWGLNQPAVLSILARCEPGNGPSIGVREQSAWIRAISGWLA